MNRIIYLLAIGLCWLLPNTRAQIITTVAGNGTFGYVGDLGPATAAELNYPNGIAVDKLGTIYIADGNACIRKVTVGGIITTIAGNGVNVHSGNGIPATAAELYQPTGVALDGNGNIYIAEAYYIRKINSVGIISSIGGIGVGGHVGDGGPATSAQLAAWELTADSAGNVFFSDGAYVRKIDTAGIITTIAGTGTLGYSGDGIAATAAMVSSPVQIALDKIGNVYFADEGNHRVRKIDKSGIISTIAGTGTSGYSGDGGPATIAKINAPQGLYIDTIGNIYIGELNHRIRRVNTAGIINTIAGDGLGSYGGEDVCATSASFWGALSLAMDGKQNLYLSDWNDDRVRMIIHDRVPLFKGGNSQVLNVCGNTSAAAINAILAATDSDAGKTDVWQMVTAPVHGTTVAGYVTTSTGSLLTPSGLTYTPAAGFVGNDTFVVSVSDCGGLSDTTTIYVRVDTAAPKAGAITGTDTVCMGGSVALTDTATGGTWRSLNTTATVIGGVVAGVAAGMDTIRYTVTNGCGADSAAYVVRVVDCKESIGSVKMQQGENVKIWPNPNNGAFTIDVPSGGNEDAQVVITNMMGQKVHEFRAPVNKQLYMQLQQPAGVYFVHVVTAEGSMVAEVELVQ